MNWLRQVTTGVGGAVLLPALLGMLVGTVTPEAGIPALVAAGVNLAFPEHKGPGWVYQISTGLGASGLVGICVAVATGALGWQAAAPLALTAVLAIFFPEQVKPPSLSGLRAIAALLLVPGLLSLVLVLAACTPEAREAVQLGCQVDGAWQPLAAAALAGAPETARLAAEDAALHPVVVAACQAAGGVPATR